MRNVVIVDSDNDVHAQAVAKRVRDKGGSVFFLDTGEFPALTQVSTTFDAGRLATAIERTGDPGKSLKDVESPFSVWWRRTHGHSLAKKIAHPSIRQFSHNELRQMLLGTLLATADKFVNDPGASHKAALKPYQLAVASGIGLRIPKTLMTNNVGDAQAFLGNGDEKRIYKTFTGAEFGLYETRIFGEQDWHELWRLSNAPLIIQEHVEGRYDIRVTVVGEDIFAARLMFHEGAHGVDSRIDRVPVHVETLTPELIKMIRQLRSRLGLAYMTVDMRFSEIAGYTFFEVNPEGQYLWIEIETGLEISDAIARLLLN
jgi:glutathione synthase/RimK-type ligase-like ATP-grasp enzyme